ncbi:hypothetical protein BBF96_04865 [Anoxybacter fermentans]|uniref:HTH tetR-type domain-containing protein n=1 Tax=Anoxybacter fermentans TaxID=1323375 RepID=A0A3Q9HR95_9FIRM|nr:TetR/AcrR family transcriptional regulator [Anoxybacter fermentans]AZR72783.1 hypothetical protein BBF96_04865 [Anoxybacter fermentans]
MKEDKRERIRQASIKVISKKGFYNTRADQIAEEAGVAVGTIYNYFSNKEEILEYIFEVELKKRLAFLEELENKEGHVLDKIHLFLQKHFNEIIKDPKVGEILVKEKQFPHRNNLNAILGYLKLIPEKLTLLLENGAKKGQIRKCNYKLIGSSLFGAIQGVVEVAIQNNELAILNEAADELTDLFFNGLKIK